MTKIAIIEDDQTISGMYRMKFEAEGFNALIASNGTAGIELVARERPDIILLDLNMPELNGAEALKQIRRLPGCIDIPVIILTNLGEEEAPKDLRTLGIAGYIVKADLTPRQVVDEVKRTLNLS
ncbi:MAG: response regulator [Candidatus Nomurabacteria bacterium]|jgi:two-component system response regulator ResD|nr:response regulator [Candidatus Nomurabacteria bacterium]